MVNQNSTSRNQPLLIGSGRLASHLSYYFKSIHLEHFTWSRHESIEVLNQLLSKSSFVMLAIRDDAIEKFYLDHLLKSQLSVVHFSGAYFHPSMISFHPLMTFTQDLYPLEFYKKIHFAVSDLDQIKRLLPQLPNSCFLLPNNKKGIYHAWAVMMASGTQSLWKQAIQQMETLGVPEPACELYLKKVTEQFFLDPKNSMTGPWVRNDQKTIEKNKVSLTDPQDQKLYGLLHSLAEKDLNLK
jgi:predicted short-subunit dehydrogenase-like oxidoreductase (DUF2520 family)